MLDSEQTPLAKAIAKRRLSNKKLSELCQQHGINPEQLDKFAAGVKPAPWLARELATTFGLAASDLTGGVA